MSSEIKELRVAQYENAKKIMYLAKELLLSSNKINIIGTTNSADIAARAAENLVRLGYVKYENTQTETIIEHNRKITRLIITIIKTNEFDKLYKENEENKKKKEEERKKEDQKE
jgi:hypothetical protein